ncbi:hypothetical protein L873DRAFT_1821412 [Choiromyces venosus 120613-1]|uniref:Uncharacterized protein n=1 Tax=Choiromyces venosus 120613-1 TaxID=1336337 RepID=A0A3N4J1E2_9PEZI|nr:hypothetical protein L873DRAFT_1821412 [Choiromyces venosus 120613-1]
MPGIIYILIPDKQHDRFAVACFSNVRTCLIHVHLRLPAMPELHGREWQTLVQRQCTLISIKFS